MLWFCSDNGPEGRNAHWPGSAGGFRGRKRSLYEGGVRVPGILVWPGKTSPGSSTDYPATTSDYLPTVLEAMQLDYPSQRPIDGVSLVDVIKSPNAKRAGGIGFQSRDQRAWHQGRFKVISTNRGKSWALYDLEADPSESEDLSNRDPARVTAMTTAFVAWQSSCQASDAEHDYHDATTKAVQSVDPQQNVWFAKYKNQAKCLTTEMLLLTYPV